MTRVWFILTTVRVLPAADAQLSPGATAITECVVPVIPIRQALHDAEVELASAGYEVVDVERCVSVNLDDKESCDEYAPDAPVWEVAASAIKAGKVLYGPFFFQPNSDSG